MHVWTCDYEGCGEIAQWHRRWKGELFKLCTKHEAYFARKHWGRRVDESQLDEDDIRYLERKERRKEFAKKNPFDVKLFWLEDGIKVRIRDRRTGERRSFMLEGKYRERIREVNLDLQKETTKPSIDDYVERLRKTKS